MIVDYISWAFILAGSLLGVAGGIGVHRFPDFFSRVHAVGVTDTLCVTCFLIGLGLQTGFSLATLKLLLIFAFLFFTSPTASHALAHTAVLGGLKPVLDQDGRKPE